MALVIEQKIINNQALVHTYSDEHKKIRQVETGILYDDAFDVPNKFTYVETDIEADIIIEPEVEETEEIENE